MKQRGLGKGLGALINPDMELDAAAQQGVREVDIRRIDPNQEQARKEFDEEKIAELAASIREHGVIQPIIVRETGGRYTIVAGERRWRAAAKAGLDTVPVLVREMDGRQLLEVSLIENLQRVDLNPMEEAEGIRFLMDEYQLTQEQVAKRIGKSRPAIANTLRLLGLEKPVRDMVVDGRLSAGHARCLVSVEPARQIALAELAIRQGLSVRELERLAQAKPPKKAEPKPADAELLRFEADLRRRLGTKVAISGSAERGSIVIQYYNREDLERIYEQFSDCST